MISYLKLSFLMFFVLITSNSLAQKSNTDKIIGCWEFKEMKFTQKVDFEKELIKNAEKVVVCFDSNGKFTSSKEEFNATIITGSYKISEDGKTIIQKSDSSNNDKDEDAEIEFLDDKLLIFKLEFGSMSLVRKEN